MRRGEGIVLYFSSDFSLYKSVPNSTKIPTAVHKSGDVSPHNIVKKQQV